MSPIIPSRYGHPKYNVIPQKSRAAALGGFKATQRGTPGSDSKSRRRQRIEESKITIQTTEDEESDNFFSKHLAAARFQRNHRLINVLFSDIVVDNEQPSDADKLQGLKKRAKSITEHLKKIDDEIVDLNSTFSVKKVKLIDDGKKFVEKLNDYVSNSKKELETLRAAQEIRRQQESTLRQQKQHQQQEQQQQLLQQQLIQQQQQNKLDIATATNIRTKTQPISNSVTTATQNVRPRTQDETPMEIQPDSNHINDVRLVLNRVVESVANAV